MALLNELPNELIISIITYLNYRNEEMINCRILNKQFKNIVEQPITTQGYPDINQISLWYFSIDYLLYRNEINRVIATANKEFDDKYINMLIDKGWI